MGIIGLDYAEARQAARELDIFWARGLKKKIQALERELLIAQSIRKSDN